jgi:CheY-like chemotaxis protein
VERAEKDLVRIREEMATQKKGMFGAFKRTKVTEKDIKDAEENLERAQTALKALQDEEAKRAAEQSETEREFEEMARRARERVAARRRNQPGSRAAKSANGAKPDIVPDTKILLVEEDPEIREATSAILEDAGYEVIAVENEAEALITIDAEGLASIGLLMTDIVAKGTDNGVELDTAASLQAQNPELKTLFISVHSDVANLISGSGVKDAGFLQRPFLGAELVKSTKQILTKKSA